MLLQVGPVGASGSRAIPDDAWSGEADRIAVQFGFPSHELLICEVPSKHLSVFLSYRHLSLEMRCTLHMTPSLLDFCQFLGGEW